MSSNREKSDKNIINDISTSRHPPGSPKSATSAQNYVTSYPSSFEQVWSIPKPVKDNERNLKLRIASNIDLIDKNKKIKNSTSHAPKTTSKLPT